MALPSQQVGLQRGCQHARHHGRANQLGRSLASGLPGDWAVRVCCHKVDTAEKGGASFRGPMHVYEARQVRFSIIVIGFRGRIKQPEAFGVQLFGSFLSSMAV